MSITEGGGPNVAGIMARVQGILLRPKAEFEKIDAENPTVRDLFVGYAMILAAIPAVAQLIGGFIPFCVMGVCVNTSPVFVIVNAIVTYILSLAMVYVGALVVNALAPSFGATQNQIKALQLTVYGWTAAWLAGIFGIYPALALLGIVGLYSLYLLYAGLPILMKAPQEKALVYTIVIIVVMILIYIVVGVVQNMILGMGRPAAPAVRLGSAEQIEMIQTYALAARVYLPA